MPDDLTVSIEESIALELNVAELYRLFSIAYPDHRAFWWQLMLEEQNHAALLKAARDTFKNADILPAEILPESTMEVQRANAAITGFISSLKTAPLSLAEAFNFAIKMEKSAGELHFQRAMSDNTTSRAMAIFQQLNGDDCDHAERIRHYKDKMSAS